MSKNGFEFSGFRRPLIGVEYKPHPSVKDGEGVQLQLNLDLLTIERMEEIEANFNEVFSRFGASLADDAAEGSDQEEGLVKKDRRISLYSYEKALFNMRVSLLAGTKGNADPNARFIHSWNVVKDGKPLPVEFESFDGMSTTAVADLYNFVTTAANNPTESEKKASGTT